MKQIQIVRGALNALLVLPVLFALSACGSDAVECPEIAGEQHLGQVALAGGSGSVMIHQVGRECPVVGENTFQLWFVAGGAMAPAIVPLHDAEAAGEDGGGMAVSTPVTVVAVDAVMPSMGHGTAVPSVIDPDHRGRFQVTFQMPGDWQILADVSRATGVTESVTFDVLVH
ncbi:MAG: hypothetical protein D6761_13140 [Candidatus Dadabacteria bacterium]|nr:MAG: hypothetical protein D6761_13140 [Candidatus Dadabacteria bacterium]